MAANDPVLQPHLLPEHDAERNNVSVAGNSELINILFRTLIDAFAPVGREKKYWWMNVHKDIAEEKVVRTGWLGLKKEIVRVLNNYEDPGALDDVESALGKLTDWTKAYIVQEEKMIMDCASAVGRNLSVKA